MIESGLLGVLIGLGVGLVALIAITLRTMRPLGWVLLIGFLAFLAAR